MSEKSEFLAAFSNHVRSLQLEFSKLDNYHDLAKYISLIVSQKLQCANHLFIHAQVEDYCFLSVNHNFGQLDIIDDLSFTGVNPESFDFLPKTTGIVPIEEAHHDRTFHLFYQKSGLHKLKFNAILPFYYGNNTVADIMLLKSPLFPDQVTDELKNLFLLYQSIFSQGLYFLNREATYMQKIAKTESDFRNLNLFVQTEKMLESFSDSKLKLIKVMDELIDRVGVERSSIAIKDKNSERLYIKVVRGGKMKDVEKKINTGKLYDIYLQKDEGVAGQVFLTGQHCIVDDVSNSPLFKNRGTPNDISSLSCWPIFHNTEAVPIGVVNLTNKRAPFSPEEIKTVQNATKKIAKLIGETEQFINSPINAQKSGIMEANSLESFIEQEFLRCKRSELSMTLMKVRVDNCNQLTAAIQPEEKSEMNERFIGLFKDFVESGDIIGKIDEDAFTLILLGTEQKRALSMAEKMRNMIPQRMKAFTPTAIAGIPMTLTFSLIETTDEVPSAQFMLSKVDELLSSNPDPDKIHFYARGRNRTYVEETISMDKISTDDLF